MFSPNHYHILPELLAYSWRIIGMFCENHWHVLGELLAYSPRIIGLFPLNCGWLVSKLSLDTPITLRNPVSQRAPNQ